MRRQEPLFKRLRGKLLHDVLPAVLASVVGGVLFTHFHLGFQFGGSSEPAAQITPASAEMMQLLRDEHGLVVSYVNAQRAKDEKAMTANESAPAMADQRQTKPAGASRLNSNPSSYIELATKAVASRAKSTSPTLAPLQIAQVRDVTTKPVVRNDDSLLAKTAGIKDHVVAATQRVVSAIGGIPSWIGAIGDRIGGDNASPRPPVNLVSTS
jgi:hypothetical protein